MRIDLFLGSLVEELARALAQGFSILVRIDLLLGAGKLRGLEAKCFSILVRIDLLLGADC